MEKSQIEEYWSGYLDTLPESEKILNNDYTAEQWGDSDELAERLCTLIVSGKKTASCSSLWEHEYENSDLPKIGIKTIVLNGNKKPVCIVETVDVQIVPYDKVGEDFAFLEGEGDRSLEYWRSAHWSFFTRSLEKIGMQPAMNMPLVCEKFKLIYK